MTHIRSTLTVGLLMFALLPLGIAPSTQAAQSNQAAVVPTLVKDTNPGSAGSDPTNFVTVNDTLFFTANDGVHGNNLWRSDGTSAGTTLVKEIPRDTSASRCLTHFIHITSVMCKARSSSLPIMAVAVSSYGRWLRARAA